MALRRFVMQPGYVISKTDGQRHWIGVQQLLKLYRIPKGVRIIIMPTEGYRPLPEDVHCTPRSDGNYPSFEDETV